MGYQSSRFVQKGNKNIIHILYFQTVSEWSVQVTMCQDGADSDVPLLSSYETSSVGKLPCRGAVHAAEQCSEVAFVVLYSAELCRAVQCSAMQ